MNNEEKILELLEKQGEILKTHGDLLEKLSLKVDELDTRSQRTALIMENEVDRKLNLLYEGHGLIMESLENLAPKSRVEALEDDVALLKDAVRFMRQEITELKKAQ